MSKPLTKTPPAIEPSNLRARLLRTTSLFPANPDNGLPARLAFDAMGIDFLDRHD